MGLKIDERFWNKVKIGNPDECWEWIGAYSSDGYGSFSFNGRSVSAHRMSYQLTHKDIPILSDADYRGTCILHSCDNPRCVNPSHLLIGSHHDNMQDMKSKHRGRTGIQSGEHNPSSKLSEQDVRDIDNMYSTKKYTLKDLASRYSVSFQTISEIINHKKWTHLWD